MPQYRILVSEDNAVTYIVDFDGNSDELREAWDNGTFSLHLLFGGTVEIERGIISNDLQDIEEIIP